MTRSGIRRSTRSTKPTSKSLKLAYAVALGGTSANENLQSTPLAEDGYLYVVDQWGVLYKIDAAPAACLAGSSGAWTQAGKAAARQSQLPRFGATSSFPTPAIRRA
jgi:hypothetical protein